MLRSSYFKRDSRVCEVQVQGEQHLERPLPFYREAVSLLYGNSTITYLKGASRSNG